MEKALGGGQDSTVSCRQDDEDSSMIPLSKTFLRQDIGERTRGRHSLE